MLKIQKMFFVAAVLAMVSGGYTLPVAYATSGCNANVSPSAVDPGSEVAVQFDLGNTGSEDILWIQVQRPTVSYSVNGITQSGWVDATDDNGTTLTASSIPAGDSYSFQLAMFTGPSEEASGPWTVLVSANADGSGAVACSGSLETSIQTPTAPPAPNGESGIGLTSVTPTTATVAWTSDVPSTSYVYYGLDATYGRTATVAGSDSTHSVLLTGLSPSTVYHFKVAGSDDSGNSLFSGDNTFVTPAAPPPAPSSPGPAAGVPTPSVAINVPGAIIKTVPTEKTPPTISLSTDLTQPFRLAPTIEGIAGDNEALARVEYSVDDGKNWLPVDKVVASDKADATSTRAIAFSFTPILSEDGNYKLQVRATDTSGNVAVSPTLTLVIDRLPPQVGEAVISFGPEVLPVGTGGLTTLVAHTDYRFTTSSIGGATEITVEARRPGVSTVESSYALTANQASGLWSGVLSLAKPGIFELTANSLDGAGNRTARPQGSVAVMPVGRTLDSHGKAIDQSKVTLYYFEPASQAWVIWDGAPYGEINPQITKHGQYSLMVPAGKYYLEATSDGFTKTLTRSVNVNKPTSLAADITLGSAPQIRIGSFRLVLPFISLAQQPLDLNQVKFVPRSTSLVGQTLPDFNLAMLNGGSRRAAQLNGRPTVLTMVNLWSPSSTDQLAALAKLQRNTDIGVVPVFAQENAAFAKNYLSTGGYTLDGLADPDGVLVGPLELGTGPKHVFLDRSGHIKKVMVGVLSELDLKHELGGL